VRDTNQILHEKSTFEMARDRDQSVEEDTYPLPTAEDLFATLAGGTVFTKLDLSSAFQQLELTEQSRELFTINTHKGLYQYQINES